MNLGGPRYGYGHRVYAYTPRVYYGGAYQYSYRDSYYRYGGYYHAYPRVEVVRVYRPAPVVIYRHPHRVYRNTRHGYRTYRHW